MKYFTNEEGCKVMLAWVTPSVFGDYAICWGLDGKEYSIPIGDVLDDGEEDSIVVSIPIEFPKGYVPPQKFDSDRCMWCPFMCVEQGVDSYCDHQHYEKENACPIRKHFVKE